MTSIVQPTLSTIIYQLKLRQTTSIYPAEEQYINDVPVHSFISLQISSPVTPSISA